MKKAQVKFGEAFGVLIIVYIVLTVGMSWYSSINEKDIREMSMKDAQNRAFEKYNFIMSLNLIRNSENENIDYFLNLNSIETFQNFTKTQNGSKYASTKLGLTNISIQLFNYSGIEDFTPYRNITLYANIPDENQIADFTTLSYKSVVPVYNPVKKQMDIGYMHIKVYVPKY